MNNMEKRFKIQIIQGFVVGFIKFFNILLSIIILYCNTAFAKNMVNLGLVGQWSNSYGHINAIEVLESTGIQENRRIGLTYAYCATSEGLVVFGMSDNNVKSFIVKSFIPLSNCTDIEVQIDKDENYERNVYVYLTAEDSRVLIINVSNPNWPFMVATCNTPSPAQGIATAAGYSYVAAGDNGLLIVDIRNRNMPKIVGICDTPGYTHDVAIEGNYAYVADGENGLQIIDISNKSAPKIIRTCDTPGYTGKVVIEGDYAYVADGDNGLQVIDVSNKNKPMIMGSLNTPGYIWDVTIAGNYAYITAGDNGFQIIDISDMHKPMIIGSCGIPGSAMKADIIGTYGYVADGRGGLQIVDIADKYEPVIVGSCDALGYVQDLVIEGEYAYIAAGESGLWIIDINDRNNLMMVGTCDTPGSALKVVIIDTYCYVADGRSGLQVIDISNKSEPLILGNCYTPGYAQDVAIAGDYAYVADGESGLQIIDISIKNGPRIIGSYDIASPVLGIAIAGDYAYVASEETGLQIIDIRSTKEPMVAGTINIPGYPEDIIIDGDYAYIIANYESLQIIDISNKNRPIITGTWDTPGFAKDVAIAGDYAYIADGWSGLQVIDISNKKEPVIVGNYDIPDYAHVVAVAGDYAYVADKQGDLLKLKIDIGSSSQGSLILVSGGSNGYEDPYWPVTQPLGNLIFNAFHKSGYEASDIFYFNPVIFQDIDEDGFPNQLVVDDPAPTRKGLQYAITEWAGKESFNTGPLYISLIGHGAEDLFQIMPNEVITARELENYIHTFAAANSRPVVVFLEAAASGSFIDDLAYGLNDSNDGTNDNTIIITSSGFGPSYLKPTSDPDTNIPISFTSLFMDAFQSDSGPNDYQTALKEAFITSREHLYSIGYPFLDQAPQMYLPHGPIAFSLHPYNPDISYDSNISLDPLIINEKSICLRAIAEYPDGSAVILDPASFRFLSSNPLVLDPNDPNQVEILSDQIHIYPDKNGLATLIAYPDPQVYPDILLTARLSIEIAIPDDPAAGGNKAIIVAGYRSGGYGIPDNLWSSTNTIVNHAYMTLRKKGYSQEDIFYFSPYFLQDVDRNLQYDDIDGHPDTLNIDQAFAEVAKTGAQELMIFLVGPGSPGTIGLNPCNSYGFTAQDLVERIYSIIPAVQGKIIILIDACYSGSFIEPVQKALQSQGDPNKVILITSTAPDQAAYFEAEGMNSFSYFFFDQFLLTNSLQDAFDHACYSISAFPQDPGFFNQLPAKEMDRESTCYVDDPRPIIIQREFSREGGKLKIRAEAYSLVGVDRVWVLITSPEKDTLEVEAEPKTDAPVYNLKPINPNAPYGGWYGIEVDDPYPDAFNYQILLSARDKTGKVATDRASISSLETAKIGAIILATGIEKSMEDKAKEYLNTQSLMAYNIFKQKEIQDKDIFYLKGRSSTLKTITEDIPSWLLGKDYNLLLIYLIGQGGLDIDKKAYFSLNQYERLYAQDIIKYINPNCRVVFLYDAPFGQEFMKEFMEEFSLDPKPGWVGITDPCIDPNYPLFFSKFFSSILASRSIGDAFFDAYHFSSISGPPSSYLYTLDFNRDNFRTIREELGFFLGRPTARIRERADSSLEKPTAKIRERAGSSLERTLDKDYRLIQEAQAIEEESLITVMVKIKESVEIDPPLAVFRASAGKSTTLQILTQEAPSLWSCSLMQVEDHPYFEVSIMVRQIDSETVDAETFFIIHPPSDLHHDIYEPDNIIEEAKPVVVNNPVQNHTFHGPADVDWVYFFGHAGHGYEINAQDISGCAYFIGLSLCDLNGVVLEQYPYSTPFWWCYQDGYYCLKVEPVSEYPDEGISYNLSIRDIQDIQAAIPTGVIGRVIDSNGDGVNGIIIRFVLPGLERTEVVTHTGSLQNIPGYSLPSKMIDGWYFISYIKEGTYELRITEENDPNIILKQVSGISLLPGQINRIEDIVLDISSKKPGASVAGELDLIYTRWQNLLGKDYPPQEDADHNGLTNLEEFLREQATVFFTPALKLKHYLDTFQDSSRRDAICLLEFSSSGSFCSNLIDPDTTPYTRTIITCTDSGSSYLDSKGQLSFTSRLIGLLKDTTYKDLASEIFSNNDLSHQQKILLLDQLSSGLFPDHVISSHQRVKILQSLFSQARDIFWASGYPFNIQPPQMVTAQGPHTLYSLTLTQDPAQASTQASVGSSLTISNPNQTISLKAIGHYLDGDLDITDHVYYQSSDPLILRVTPHGGEAYANPNTTFNGEAFILATIIDPNFSRAYDHDPGLPPLPPLGGVTGRIAVTVDIPARTEKTGLPLAIIVAGKKDIKDYLWQETDIISRYAYRTFLGRGYSRSRIKYLTHLRDELLQDTNPNNDNDTDLDGDGDPNNDIGGIPSRSTLEAALLDWVKGTDNLTLFLVNHGVERGFYLNPDQILDPDTLDRWLDELQKENNNLKITLIIECCHSGQFIEPLKGDKRIIITSNKEGESHIYTHGLLSFSYPLFTYLQSEANLEAAYEKACRDIQKIPDFDQNPQLWHSSLLPAESESLGGPFLISEDQPVITSAQIFPGTDGISPGQELTIWTWASDPDGISKVWAMVNVTYSPPVFSGNPDQPIVDFPLIDLSPRGGVLYEGTYSGFTHPGPYTLFIFAQDTKGNVSLPYSVFLDVSGQRQKALLLAGYDPSDPDRFDSILSSARWVLQGKRFSQVELLPKPGGARPTLQEVHDTLKRLGQDANQPVDQLFVYLIGPTQINDNNDNLVTFPLNMQKESLTPGTLNTWLDELSDCNQVVLLLDARGAKSFVKTSPNRINVWSASENEEVRLGQAGYPAFSQFFLSRIYCGESIYQAFLSASDALRYYSNQTPGIELEQVLVAQATCLGSPLVFKIAGPAIIVPPDRKVWGYETLWAEVKNSSPDTKVWALIKEPGQDLGESKPVESKPGELKEVRFTSVREGRYEAGYFFTRQGTYEVNTYVQDANGLIDYAHTRYFKIREEDPYEDDDTPEQATPILINVMSNQLHNFHTPSNNTPATLPADDTPNDEDWLVFHAYKGKSYEIHINRYWDDWSAHDCNLVASIHYLDGDNVLDDYNNPLQLEYTNFNIDNNTPEIQCPKKLIPDQYQCLVLPETGFYLIRFTYGCEQLSPGTPAYYEIVKITDGLAGPTTGTICGHVLHSKYHQGIVGATIKAEIPTADGKTQEVDTTKSGSGGIFYLLDPKEGNYQVHATAPGYRDSLTSSVPVISNSVTSFTIYLSSNPQDPNKRDTSRYVDLQKFQQPVETAYKDCQKEHLITLHRGMNLFSCPCLPLDPNSTVSTGFLQEVRHSINTYYQKKGLPSRFSMDIRRYDAQDRQWQACFMDANQKIQGDIFSLDPHEGYLVYLDIDTDDPNNPNNVSNTIEESLTIPFTCTATDLDRGGYDWEPGINLIGFSQSLTEFDSQRLLEDPKLKDALGTIFHYVPQKGSFYPHYQLFGKPAGEPCQFMGDNGYSLFIKRREGVHDWQPK